MPSTIKTFSRNVNEASSQYHAPGEEGGGGMGGREPVRPFRRKRRAWLFRIDGATNRGEKSEGSESEPMHKVLSEMNTGSCRLADGCRSLRGL